MFVIVSSDPDLTVIETYLMPPRDVIIPKISVKIDIIVLSLLKEKILIKFSYSLCLPVI